jgi:hypothetical protein
MIVNYPIQYGKEVSQETAKQSNKRLTKVNHSKEWGAKPLV